MQSDPLRTGAIFRLRTPAPASGGKAENSARTFLPRTPPQQQSPFSPAEAQSEQSSRQVAIQRQFDQLYRATPLPMALLRSLAENGQEQQAAQLQQQYHPYHGHQQQHQQHHQHHQQQYHHPFHAQPQPQPQLQQQPYISPFAVHHTPPSAGGHVHGPAHMQPSHVQQFVHTPIVSESLQHAMQEEAVVPAEAVPEKATAAQENVRRVERKKHAVSHTKDAADEEPKHYEDEHEEDPVLPDYEPSPPKSEKLDSLATLQPPSSDTSASSTPGNRRRRGHSKIDSLQLLFASPPKQEKMEQAVPKAAAAKKASAKKAAAKPPARTKKVAAAAAAASKEPSAPKEPTKKTAPTVPRVWTEQEIEALHVAHSSLPVNDRNFWSRVAKQLPGRTAAECQAQWFAAVSPEKKRKASSKKRVAPERVSALSLSPPAESATKSTDERAPARPVRKQRAAVVAARKEMFSAEEDDLFNHTPMKVRKRSFDERVVTDIPTPQQRRRSFSSSANEDGDDDDEDDEDFHLDEEIDDDADIDLSWKAKYASRMRRGKKLPTSKRHIGTAKKVSVPIPVQPGRKLPTKKRKQAVKEVVSHQDGSEYQVHASFSPGGTLRTSVKDDENNEASHLDFPDSASDSEDSEFL